MCRLTAARAVLRDEGVPLRYLLAKVVDPLIPEARDGEIRLLCLHKTVHNDTANPAY